MRRLCPAALALTLILCVPAVATARDPGRWTLTGWSSVPNAYWQGVATAGPGQPFFFSGTAQGLHRTGRNLRQTATEAVAIPEPVYSAEGYNHIGDIAFESGRVLLPLECYTFGGPNGGNTCGTGAIGSANPRTLAFDYYVKLDPAEIPKAMWVESHRGLLWTSSGRDLLAYRASDVSAANAAPGAAPIRSVRRLAGAVPPSGITGAAIHRGRLLLAGARGPTYQIWSVDLDTGVRRLEIELRGVRGEAEGLAQVPLLGSRLHFLVAPLGSGPSFGPTVGMLHFATGNWRTRELRVTARPTRRLTLRPRVHVRVTRRGKPVRAVVRMAGVRAVTDRDGRATVTPRLGVAGAFAAVARTRRLRGRSRFVPLGPVALGARSAAVRTVPAR